MNNIIFRSSSLNIPVTDRIRALIGFFLGFMIMLVVVQIFVVNSFDFENMQRGVGLIFRGINPWAAETRISHFYNPPFSVIFLWPMLFATQKFFLVLGGALLFAFTFYHKAWVALAWFATNTFLWLIAAGGIDMFLIGAGLILLLVGDRTENKWIGLVCRVSAYGILMIKPQGGIFIVALYILLRRDWKGLLISILIYGILFIPLYPDWINVLIDDPPLAQTEASHTIWGKFGPGVAAVIALSVVISRKWKFWELGGALAGIMMPYGMPGIPIFLTLSGVRKLIAIPIVIVFSGCLAVLTWINPPIGEHFYKFISPFMAIYHLSMIGLALALACITGTDSEDSDTIDFAGWIKQRAKLSESKNN